MTFVFLGIIILLVQLPLGWTAGYVLKTIGFALCAAGFSELREHCAQDNKNNKADPPVRESGLGGIAVWRAVSRLLSAEGAGGFRTSRLKALDMLRKNAVTGMAAGIISAGAAAVFEFVSHSSAGNYVTSLCGAVMTFLALRLAGGITAFLCEHDKLCREYRLTELLFCDTGTDLLRMKDLINKTGICMAVNLICDILNRVVPLESVQTYAGFMAFVSKLTLYVFVITAAVRTNAVRAGFYRRHPKQPEED
ncbi:hypothetical protein [Ruminococcus sp.]|uniref:hypothetical protein n=1 Tax=Ruminococcus sp. TaxID=41978 RepID=UPI0025DA6468|nr:hypothetical protein [Ruminococcus sp.]MBQ8966330.1 hypothetical protein [Ruminococcus sp.]